MTSLRETALNLFRRTLAAIEVESVVRAHLCVQGEQLWAGDESYDLSRYARLLVLAIGKASLPMARAAEAALGERISDGLVVTNALLGAPPRRLPCVFGSHPLPNRGSVVAAELALQKLREHDGAETLALFLLSGGGSAMFEKPIDPAITLADLQAINRVLVGCGAVIAEMNVVRRFLSAVKGGRLAAAAPCARQLSLYISDVNSDDLATVSSGPTLPSAITRDDFNRIVERYKLLEHFPAHVAELITAGRLPDLPQAGDAARASHQLLLDNRRALLVAKQLAERDYNCVVEIAEDLVEGEVAELARLHLARVAALRAKHPGRLVCLLSGGEAICPVRGKGQGGRNQEFVLRAAQMLDEQGLDELVVLSAGTDGIDGNSPATGAIADSRTVWRANELGISSELHLRNSDSFNFFDRLGDAIITGPTGNNVRDVRLLLADG